MLKDLRRVCVGGAFGRYLDVGSAQAIGLLSSLAAERLDQLRSRARLINLAHYPDFDQAFLENLYLQPLQEA